MKNSIKRKIASLLAAITLFTCLTAAVTTATAESGFWNMFDTVQDSVDSLNISTQVEKAITGGKDDISPERELLGKAAKTATSLGDLSNYVPGIETGGYITGLISEGGKLTESDDAFETIGHAANLLRTTVGFGLSLVPGGDTANNVIDLTIAGGEYLYERGKDLGEKVVDAVADTARDFADGVADAAEDMWDALSSLF